MGNVGSGRRQRQDQIHRHNHHHALPAPPPPPNGRYPAYVFAANAPYHVQQPPPYGPPPPDPYHHPTYQSMPPIAPPLPPPPQLYHHQVYGQQRQPGPWAYTVRPPPPQGWSNGSQLSSSQQQQQQQPPQPPPPYVEHHKTTTIRNDVNLKKETLHLEKDEQHPDQYLVSFSFDSMVSGSISIFFFAKEGGNCGLTALKPDICPPLKIPFEKGLGQKFCQPSGTGIDLSFFEEVELTKVEADEVYPLVIRAEACSSQMPPIEPSETDQIGNPLPTSINSQITQAVFEKKDNGEYRVKVIKQILWVDGVRYELQEIYGIGSSAGSDFDANDPGKECVICMSEPRDTTVLPCRHMCMCSECAKLLRLQTNRCPICRRPVERLMEIKVNKNDEPENELP